MILNNNSTQQINTLIIQLQNRITNLSNESKKLNKEISELDTEISDLDNKINNLDSSQTNDTAAMNAEIKANTKAISNEAAARANADSALQTAIDGKASSSHNHDDRYYTESEIDTKLSGKADKSHTHTKSQITDFPTSLKNPNALTVNGKTYDGSSAVNAGVQTVENGGTGVTTQADINKAFIGNLDTGEADVTDGTEFVSSWASDNGFAETAEGANTPYKRQFIKVWNYIKGKISSVLGLTKDNYGGKSAKSSFLDEYVGAGGTRPKSGNIVPKDSSEYGGMRKDVVTSSMTDSGHPGQDGHLLTMFWDSNGRWDTQLFLNCEEPPALKVRVKQNTSDYGPWVDIITSQNIGSQTVAKASTAVIADKANNGTFGMLGGTKQAETDNFEDLLNNELCSNQTGGLKGGSIQVPVGQEANNLGIPVGTWYNFLYIPHRTGIDGDNYMFGTLFVTPMISNDGTFYIIHRINGHNYPAHKFNSAT